MKLIVKGGLLSKADKARIRGYCKDFDTRDLTVVVTSDWTFKPIKKNHHRKIKYALSNLRGLCSGTVGVFHSGFSNLRDIYGFRNLNCPLIAIKIPQCDWWHTFLHEFGHYVDWKTNGFQYRSKKSREKFARCYADKESKRKS